MKGRVGIVGGSVAGCAAAVAAVRAGCDVTLFERSTTLADRGLAIGMPVHVHRELTETGYVNPDMPSGLVTRRLWVVADPAEPNGRVLWQQPIEAVTVSWGQLWRSVANGVADQVYRSGLNVTAVAPDGVVTAEDGQRHEFDLVVGADGYQSLVRSVVSPSTRPQQAPYFMVRGVVPDRDIPADLLDMVDSTLLTVVYPGGHGIFYLVPTGAGDWALSWNIYVHREHHDAADHLARFLPAAWAELCQRTESMEEYSVTDVVPETYGSSPFLLVGDAAAQARPHTAAGTTKALQDAICLQRVLESGSSWDDVLAAYDAERRPAGDRLVEFGRKMGYAQVENTPPWASMTADDMATWAADVLAAHHKSIYQSN